MRQCGPCNICCIHATIDEINKPAQQPCPNLDLSKSCNHCKIYDDRPEQCKLFTCSWIQGFGTENDRPNNNDLLVYVNEFNNGTWVVIIELAENALITNGRTIIPQLLNQFNTAGIVMKYGYTKDTGDWTVLRDKDLYRSNAMRGEFIAWLENGIGVYELINPLE